MHTSPDQQHPRRQGPREKTESRHAPQTSRPSHLRRAALHASQAVRMRSIPEVVLTRWSLRATRVSTTPVQKTDDSSCSIKCQGQCDNRPVNSRKKKPQLGPKRHDYYVRTIALGSPAVYRSTTLYEDKPAFQRLRRRASLSQFLYPDGLHFKFTRHLHHTTVGEAASAGSEVIAHFFAGCDHSWPPPL